MLRTEGEGSAPVEHARLRVYRPAPTPDESPTDLGHVLPRPSAPDVLAAMRAVPLVLTECLYSALAADPGSPCGRSVLHAHLLWYARTRGHGLAATAWAVQDLADRGMVAVERPLRYQDLAPGEFANLYPDLWEGQPRSARCDLFPLGAVLEVVSRPALWEWWRAGSPDWADAEPPKPVRPKRSSCPGSGRTKLIAALTCHHGYQRKSFNPTPVGNNELARLADVSPSTASAFFRTEFGGWEKYQVLCEREPGALVNRMKMLNGEFREGDVRQLIEDLSGVCLNDAA